MKRKVKNILFGMHMVYRRIMHEKLRSLIMVLSITTLFVMLILAFSSRTMIENYYLSRQESTYLPYDLRIETDQNTNARFFSISPLVTFESSNDDLISYIPLFESHILVSIDEEKTYVNLFAGQLSHFREIVETLEYVHSTIGPNDVIVTESFARKHQVGTNQSIDLWIGSQTYAYQIVEVVKDQRFFKEQSIFVGKASIIRAIITEIEPSYSIYPDQVFNNLYNKVYLETKDSVAVMNGLSEITAYKELLIEETINYEAINQFVEKNTVVFELMISIIVIAIIMVMITTFKLYFDTKRFEEAILSILGGRKHIIMSLTLFELFIFLSIGFITSLFVTHYFIRYALLQLSSEINYTLGIKEGFYAAVAGTLCSLISFMIINHHQIESLNQRVKNSKPTQWVSKPSNVIKVWIVFLIISVILFGIDQLLSNLQILIPMMISFFIFSFLTLLISFVLLMRFVSSNHRFGLFMRMMLHEKSYLLLTMIIFTISISLLLLVHGNNHLAARVDHFQDEYTMDMMMTNISTSTDLIKSEIEVLPNVATVDQTFYFKDTLVDEKNIAMLISIRPESIHQYFNLQIDEEVIGRSRDALEPSIILPNKFHETFKYQIGDSVYIHINKNYPNERYIIAGFFEKTNDNLAFIHHMQYEKYQGLGYNALLVNSIGDASTLHQELLIQYSKHMITIIDRESLFSKTIFEMNQMVKLINIVMIAIAVSFMLAAINYSLLLYQKMKINLTKLRIIGYSKKSIIIYAALESVIQTVLILVFSFITYYMIINHLTKLTVLIGEYEKITHNEMTITIGLITTFSTILLVRIAYLMKIRGKERLLFKI